jgi:hypothetical protein
MPPPTALRRRQRRGPAKPAALPQHSSPSDEREVRVETRDVIAIFTSKGAAEKLATETY